MSVSYLRHNKWFGPEDAENMTLNIIGIGATGSWVGYLAARMGFFDFKVWDGDIVEDHNLPNQIYQEEHIGMKKVDAFRQVLTHFNSEINVETFPKYFKSKEDKDQLSGPLILTVDTMAARKDLIKSFKLNYKVKNVYETRLGFDFGELNVFDSMDLHAIKNWTNTLKSDKEVEEGPCNLRICPDLVTIIASVLVHQLCGNLSAERRDDKNWKVAPKTVFSLGAQLETYSFN